MEQESQIDKSGYNIKKYMDEIKLNHLEKYIDKNICYDYLLMYNKQQEFIDFATLKGDYELIIQKLLNHLNYEEILNKLDKFINSDIDETIMKKLIKIFFEYSNFFMKESPVKTINLLEKELISEFNQDEIINVIIDSDVCNEIDDQFAIAYALTSKSLNVSAITIAPFMVNMKRISVFFPYFRNKVMICSCMIGFFIKLY